MNKEIVKDSQNKDSRADKLKKYSIGSVLILAVIIILGNFLLEKLFGRALTFDFSYASHNSISQESIDFLDGLSPDTHIRIVGLFNRPSNVEGTPYQYIIPLLDDYVRNGNGKVTVEYIDPNEKPTIISELDPDNSFDLASQTSSFVVQYNGKIRIISPIDCYYYDESYYSTYGTYVITGNNTEFTFTNTMYALTQGISNKAYIVTGLKEEGNENITKILESMLMDVEYLPDSDSFTIPEDCSLLVLNGPNTDISENMYVAISDYMNNGGKLFVAVDYSTYNVTEKYDRLNKLLAQMNITIDPLLVYENDPGYQLSGSALNSVVTVNEYFKSYVSFSYLTNAYARNVRESDNPNPDFATLPVLATSSNAQTLKLDTSGNVIEDGVEDVGQHYVAMYAVKDGITQSEAFVFGTLSFSSDEYINQHSLNDINIDFFRACIRELTDADTGSQLNIQSKNIDAFNIDAAKATTSTSTLMLVIFMLLIPIALIAMAVIVYFKRKNL